MQHEVNYYWSICTGDIPLLVTTWTCLSSYIYMPGIQVAHEMGLSTKMSIERIKEMKIPFRCPICLGKGIVQGGFYTSVGPVTISSTAFDKCRQCDGTGIIWSNGSKDKHER